MKSQNKAYVYAGLTILFWGTSASAFKIGLRYLDYFQLLLIANFTSFLFLLIVLLFQKKLILIKQFSIKDYSRSILLGFLNPFL